MRLIPHISHFFFMAIQEFINKSYVFGSRTSFYNAILQCDRKLTLSGFDMNMRRIVVKSI